MPASRYLTADRGDAGLRLDLVLRRHLTDVRTATRTRVQRWIEDGRVTVNGRLVTRVAARAAFGDAVVVDLPDVPAHLPPVGENLKLSILYEDAHLLAVNKPAGLVAHPTHRHAGGTLLNGLLWHARDWPVPLRPSLVSRLDKHTSGLILVAKTAAAHTALQRAMAGRDAEKDYCAVVYGRVPTARGEIDLRLRRDPGDRRRVIASPTVGAVSLTRYERLVRVRVGKTWMSLLRCRLITGRTHQLRVHLAASGWPMVGDAVYGEPRWSLVSDGTLRQTLKTFPRQALHAWRVTFTHPMSGARVRIEAPWPEDLKRLAVSCGLRTSVSPEPWALSLHLG